MVIGSVTSTAIGNQVWITNPRSLTNMGALVIVSVSQTFLPALMMVDLRPTQANRIRDITIAYTAGAAGLFTVGIYDGSVFTPGNHVANGGNGAFTMTGNPALGAAVQNSDATNSAIYAVCGHDWIS